MIRVVLSFEDGSFTALEVMTAEGRYDDIAAAVQESLQINRTLMMQARQGFTEVLLRNPSTGDLRSMEVPRLPMIAARYRE